MQIVFMHSYGFDFKASVFTVPPSHFRWHPDKLLLG